MGRLKSFEERATGQGENMYCVQVFKRDRQTES